MASVEIINPAQIDSGEPIEIQLSMSNIVYRGPAGPQGPRGPVGPQGAPGFYVGTSAPEGDDSSIEVWIDPNGEAMPVANSVNGKTGDVILTASDIGALSDSVELQRFELLSNTDILDIWNTI